MADNIDYKLFQKVEKWTTKENFNALGNLTEIETGTEYNLAGPIDESDLASDLLAKINGKLTAPTTPTADSAVTMLADGTVGTKLLSEIGGGGKLYLHYILKTTGDVPVYFSLWSSSTDQLTTVDKLFEYYQVPQYQNRLIPCTCGGVSTNKIGVLILDYTSGMSKAATITYTDSNGVKTETISDNLIDIVIEV